MRGSTSKGRQRAPAAGGGTAALQAEVERLTAQVAALEARLAAKPAIDRAPLFRVADALPWGVLAVSAERRIDYANPAAGAWLAVDPPAMGASLDEAILPGLLADVAASVQQGLAGQPADGEFAFTAPSGETRELKLVVTPRSSGAHGVGGCIVQITDLTHGRTLDAVVRDSESRLRLAMEAGRMAVWEFDVRTGKLVMSDELYRLLGYAEGATPTPEDIRAGYVAEDWDRLVASAQAAIDRGSYAVEAELRHRGPDGLQRTFLLRLEMLRDDRGRVVQGYGVLVDITERKRAEMGLRTVVNELNHRVKNTLATVQSMIRQSLRDPADPTAAWHDLSDRIVAFAAAHDLITEHSWSGADLRALVARATASAPPEQMSLEGPALRLSPKLALSLALALHELLTNAYKHGALSTPRGRVAISWSQGEPAGPPVLTLRWEESGGPAISAPPSRTGFGSRLLRRALPSDLGGKVELEFPATGAVCVIEAPLPEG